MPSHRFGLLALCALVVAGCDGGDGGTFTTAPPPPTKPGVLAISASPQLEPPPITQAEIDAVNTAAFNLVYNAGARGQMTTFRWNELEPTGGTFDSSKFNDLNAAIANAQSHGMVQYLGIKVIDTTARQMPTDLESDAFDLPAVETRFHSLLSAVIAPNVGKIKYLAIGNEVDVYLRAHPTEWDQYQHFYADAVQYAHTVDPAIQVGVTATADGALTQSPGLLRSLDSSSDVIILTYYPLIDNAGNVTVRDPSAPSSDFPQMLNFAGVKPLVLQEVGYPASTLNASSETKQSQFVQNVFTAWQNSGGKIPFLNYFLLHDFPQQLCDALLPYYGQSNNASFSAYLCSLGLRKVDDTPRAAWSTLTAAAAQAGLP